MYTILIGFALHASNFNLSYTMYELKAIKAIWFEIFSIGGQTQNCQIMLDGLIRQAVAILARWAHKFNW